MANQEVRLFEHGLSACSPSRPVLSNATKISQYALLMMERIMGLTRKETRWNYQKLP